MITHNGSNATDFLTDDELRKVLDWLEVNNKKVFNACSFVFLTGLRYCDVEALLIHNIMRRGMIADNFTITLKKTKQRHKVHLNDDSLLLLSEMLYDLPEEPETKLFPTSRSWVNRVLKKACDKLNINKVVAIHSFRKTHAVKLEQVSGSVSVVQQSLGHTSLTHTTTYLANAKGVGEHVSKLSIMV